MPKTYDVDYFIKKFEAIKEEKWIEGQFSDNGLRFCALGHCGSRDDDNEIHTPEGNALIAMFRSTLNYSVASVNDYTSCLLPQPTPKLRILAALRYIKEKQCPSSS